MSTAVLEQDTVKQQLGRDIWCQRLGHPTVESFHAVLDVLREASDEGESVLPIGLVADVLQLASGRVERRSLEQVPAELRAGLRAYEDYFLSRLFADPKIERALQALGRYRGRDWSRAAAFLVTQIRHHLDVGGYEINPALLKVSQETGLDELLAEGRTLLDDSTADAYAAIVASSRVAADLLGVEDVFELEHGTALFPFGERVALRHTLQAMAALEHVVPVAARTGSRWRNVPTRMLEEDAYPVGGYSSISTRGTIESLMHSQLAYMETDVRPDLFDIKYVRDELFYYARDENQFRRRRRSFAFWFEPELTKTRVRDGDFAWQRLTVALGFSLATVQRLTEWLSGDALTFTFLFPADGDGEPLVAERVLVETILRLPIRQGLVQVRVGTPEQHQAWCGDQTRHSLCQVVRWGWVVSEWALPDAATVQFGLKQPRPQVVVDGEPVEVAAGWDGWLGLSRTLIPSFV
jgi:hypothetical protein